MIPSPSLSHWHFKQQYRTDLHLRNSFIHELITLRGTTHRYTPVNGFTRESLACIRTQELPINKVTYPPSSVRTSERTKTKVDTSAASGVRSDYVETYPGHLKNVICNIHSNALRLHPMHKQSHARKSPTHRDCLQRFPKPHLIAQDCADACTKAQKKTVITPFATLIAAAPHMMRIYAPQVSTLATRHSHQKRDHPMYFISLRFVCVCVCVCISPCSWSASNHSRLLS